MEFLRGTGLLLDDGHDRGRRSRVHGFAPREVAMRSDDLACANCGGLVADGGCPVCRSTREQLARERFTISAPVLAFVLAVLALALVFVARHAG
jgi:hypothetical protein